MQLLSLGGKWAPIPLAVRSAAAEPDRGRCRGLRSLSLLGALHRPPGASRRRCPEAGPCLRPCRGMKRIFGFGRKKKGQPPSGSNSLPSPGAYELRQKDLGKLHRAAANGDLIQVRQGLKKYSVDGQDKADR